MPKFLEPTIDSVLDDAAGTSPGRQSIAPLEVEVYAMPATQGQERFWSLDQLNPGNAALNMPLMWQCTGALNVAAMKTAFTECVQRHESLRTTFAMTEGRLCQIIRPATPVDIPVDDLTALSGEAQRLEADRITRNHAALRMDLANGPLLELKLLKLSVQHHVLLVTMHHVICDGISNGILMRDMMAFYEAIVQHGKAELPELPIQFADYAVWHQDWCAGDEHDVSLDFWRESLGNDFTPIRLPHDASAAELLPAHRASSTGDIETLLVPPALSAKAHAFCVRQGVTLNVLLFSVFTALLSKLTDKKDLTIGSPCANRNEDTEDLIGMFMNIQVLRVRLQETSTFRDLLQQVQDWTIAAVDNQSLPFEEIVNDPFFSSGTGSLEIPIFFLYQKSFMLTRRIESAAGSLQIVPLRSESPGAIFEMMFAIVDREEEGPRLQLEYNPQYFKATTIQNYLRFFVNLLDSALTNPDAIVDDLKILSAKGRESVLTRWNQTTVDFGGFEPLHAALLRRAAAQPERVALECAGKTWTYNELASRATALAYRLVAEGVRAGDLVGICTGRSPHMVAAMLGIHMAGAAYVPLDPRHPAERRAMVLADSKVSQVLTDHVLNVDASVRTLDVTVVHQQDTKFLPNTSSAENLAYVIYTSGSTGVPKGVAIQHGALMNLLRSMEREPGLTPDDVLVAITTLAFDISVLELLLPLLTGAKLVIATDDEVQTPALLLKLLETSKATVLQATPGAWRTLIEEGWTKELPLKVLCGGEALSRDLADKLLERSPDVWNMYGPTETTVWSSATRLTPDTLAPRVGPPMANTQFYVLDKKLRPVPLEQEGELYIGGAGLARGYWNRPELTAQKFVPNPFGNGRIYQTGDLARMQSDGTMQLLGRADFQVKVRGYRIELGEIEARLEAHPHVREAVVMQHVMSDRPGRTGVTRLIAYVDAGQYAETALAATLVAELEAHLGRTIPDYMLPNVIRVLEKLPRNTNGKVDRKALPEVFDHAGDAGIRTNASQQEGFLGPRDILELQLTDLWQSSLGISQISIRASFFSLGVGSLAALRLVTRMNRIYSMQLGLASLVSASSIESIAELIRNRFSANNSSTLVPIRTDGAGLPLFIVHGVGGNIFNFYGLAKRIDADRPVYAIQSQALLDGQPALLHLEDMAAYYNAELRKVQPQGPYHLLGYSFGGTVVLEMAQQLRLAGQKVALVGMLDSRSKPFEDERLNELSVQAKIDRRLRRLRGNTVELTWRERAKYLSGKARTRFVRFMSQLAGALNLVTLPAFLKSAYDINQIAINRYKLRAYDGHLVLFRASDQEFHGGPRDLGWGTIFSEGVEIHEITGDHERIFLEPGIDILAMSIRDSLQRCDA